MQHLVDRVGIAKRELGTDGTEDLRDPFRDASLV